MIQDFPDKFNENDYKVALGKSLKFLFNAHKRFVNIDKQVEKIGKMKNINLISFFDCCREIPPTKGMNEDKKA